MKKKFFKKNNLKYWAYLWIFVFILIFTSIFLVNNIKTKQYEDYYMHVASDTEFITAHIINHLQSGDYSGVKYFLQNWYLHTNRISETKLTSKNGFILSHNKHEKIINKTIYFKKKITYSYHGEVLLEIYSNYDQIDNNIKNVSLIIILIIFLFTLASGFITWLALKKRSLASNLGKSKDELVLNMQRLEDEIIEREKIEKKISRLATVVEQADQAIVITGLDGNIEYVNPAFEGISGYSFKDVSGKNSRILNGGGLEPGFYQELWDRIGSGKTWHGVFYNKKKNGSFYYESAVLFPIKNKDGEIVNYAGVKQDITVEKKLQEQLRQSQKMEAIGTLAGGIAHDFNNILGVIMGYTELTIDELSGNDELISNLNKVMNASDRAREMIQQILSFSRKSDTEMKPVYIKRIIEETKKFLRASIPTTIEIKLDIDEDTGQVYANGTQINQILMNFCTNAAYAMRENGGILEISLKNIEIGKDDNIGDLIPGSYQLLQVKDSGTGIEKDILDKIFDPYFTTKKVGEGTGMGLAVAYGIVKSYRGYIHVYSELSEGTCFNVYFPVMESKSPEQNEMSEGVNVAGKGEKILLVDDEKDLAEVGASILEKLGYEVEAMNGSLEAFEAFKSNPEKYDLLITDKTMPGITGIKLTEKILEIRPDLPVILCTGLVNGLSKINYEAKGFNALIKKPVNKDDLSKAVRKVLDKRIDKKNLLFKM